MIIGVVSAVLSIPASQSLKDKRAVLRSLRDRLINKMNVSAAEVGMQDSWKMAEMAFVTVAAETDVVQKRISDIDSFLNADPTFTLVRFESQIL